MKNYSVLALLLLIILGSCSKDEVSPDQTTEFVGAWKGELVKETGYENRTDWTITRISDNSIKIVSRFNFISTSPTYQSYTRDTTIEPVSVPDRKTMKASYNMPVSGDTLVVDAVGIITENSLTVTSNGKFKKTGKSITPSIQKFVKQ